MALHALASGHRHAHLPPGATAIRLLSKTFIPNRQSATAQDSRRLGVAVASLRRDAQPLPDAAYGQGWHAPEPGWRWTDGAAWLHLAPCERASRLEIATQPDAGPGYWQAPRGRRAKAA